jgi:hypothetical protein
LFLKDVNQSGDESEADWFPLQRVLKKPAGRLSSDARPVMRLLFDNRLED